MRADPTIVKQFLWGVAGLALVGLTGVQTASAQGASKFIRKGNKLYHNQQFTDAEAEYKKALSKDSVSSAGLFNLGNSLYSQKRYGEAMQQYAASAEHSSDSLDQAAAQYNIGNTLSSEKKWQKAIQSYKQTLLRNPSDEDARYNLAYAQQMLKKQQGGGGGKQQQPNNQNQDQKQNKNQSDQNQQNNQNQQSGQDKQPPQPRPRPGSLDKQRADQLLDAAAQAEKKLQEDKDKKKQGVPVYKGKDW
jgi:tetratricopeptide (TPR) repeat protein